MKLSLTLSAALFIAKAYAGWYYCFCLTSNGVYHKGDTERTCDRFHGVMERGQCFLHVSSESDFQRSCPDKRGTCTNA
ncbi:hypothetical protein LZ32DRAFT_460555 [Colletotrichum eremochloae]|nr:hypothetical protein LZ32DRAFT_460555 [Colletotrichum eremochloae]